MRKSGQFRRFFEFVPILTRLGFSDKKLLGIDYLALVKFYKMHSLVFIYIWGIMVEKSIENQNFDLRPNPKLTKKSKIQNWARGLILGLGTNFGGTYSRANFGAGPSHRKREVGGSCQTGFWSRLKKVKLRSMQKIRFQGRTFRRTLCEILSPLALKL